MKTEDILLLAGGAYLAYRFGPKLLAQTAGEGIRDFINQAQAETEKMAPDVKVYTEGGYTTYKPFWAFVNAITAAGAQRDIQKTITYSPGGALFGHPYPAEELTSGLGTTINNIFGGLTSWAGGITGGTTVQTHGFTEPITIRQAVPGGYEEKTIAGWLNLPTIDLSFWD